MLDRQETIEHARFRALAQITLTVGIESSEAREEGTKAFDDYMKVAFPNLESKRKQKEIATKQALSDWIKQGPLKVTPSMQARKLKSRMVQRVQEVDHGRSSRLYTKMKRAKYGS